MAEAHSGKIKRDRQNGSTTLSTANLTFPEGFVPLDSPYYIRRSPIESICYETIAKSGSFIRIKGARWMGKTSLIHRILEHGRVCNHRSVYLDFDNIERSILQDWGKLLRWLCATISRQLELPDRVKSYWDKNCLGKSDSCTAYFEEYVLGKSDRNIVLVFELASSSRFV